MTGIGVTQIVLLQEGPPRHASGGMSAQASPMAELRRAEGSHIKNFGFRNGLGVGRPRVH